MTIVHVPGLVGPLNLGAGDLQFPSQTGDEHARLAMLALPDPNNEQAVRWLFDQFVAQTPRVNRCFLSYPGLVRKESLREAQLASPPAQDPYQLGTTADITGPECWWFDPAGCQRVIRELRRRSDFQLAPVNLLILPARQSAWAGPVLDLQGAMQVFPSLDQAGANLFCQLTRLLSPDLSQAGSAEAMQALMVRQVPLFATAIVALEDWLHGAGIRPTRLQAIDGIAPLLPPEEGFDHSRFRHWMFEFGLRMARQQQGVPATHEVTRDGRIYRAMRVDDEWVELLDAHRGRILFRLAARAVQGKLNRGQKEMLQRYQIPWPAASGSGQGSESDPLEGWRLEDFRGISAGLFKREIAHRDGDQGVESAWVDWQSRSDDAQWQDRWQLEKTLLERVDGLFGIAGPVRFGLRDDLQFRMCPLAKGEGLAQWLAQDPDNTARMNCVRNLSQLLAALNAAELYVGNLIRHTVLVDADGAVTLMDPERMVGEYQPSDSQARSRQFGGMTETVGRAPEHLRDSDLPNSPRSDVYALGVAAYWVLSGQLPDDPHSFDTPFAYAFHKIQQAPRPPSQARPQLGERYDEVFAKALAIDPEQRFADVAEFARALADL